MLWLDPCVSVWRVIKYSRRKLFVTCGPDGHHHQILARWKSHKNTEYGLWIKFNLPFIFNITFFNQFVKLRKHIIILKYKRSICILQSNIFCGSFTFLVFSSKIKNSVCDLSKAKLMESLFPDQLNNWTAIYCGFLSRSKSLKLSLKPPVWSTE